MGGWDRDSGRVGGWDRRQWEVGGVGGGRE